MNEKPSLEEKADVGLGLVYFHFDGKSISRASSRFITADIIRAARDCMMII